MNMIIIDDEQDIINIFTEIFTAKSYNVVGTAKDMYSAIKIIKEIQTDVILLDISLTQGGNEGIDILAECRNYTNADIFIVTSAMDNNLTEMCYALGAFFYVSKSVLINSPDILSLTIQNRIQQDMINSRFVLLEKNQIINSLTNREIEALKLKENGFTYTQIAKHMFIESESAKRIVARARSKIRNTKIGKFIKKIFVF